MSLWSLQEAKKYTDKEVKTVDDRITTLTIEQQQDGEVIEARKGEVSLKAKMDSVDAQLAQTATKDELNALGQLKMDGVYDTLSALQTANPTGTTGLHLVIEDGFTYRWDGLAWVKAVEFQSTSSILTMDNLVTNGDFSQGVDYWSASGFTLSASDNTLTATVTTLDTANRILQSALIPIVGHLYYVKTKIKPKYSNNTFFGIGANPSPIIKPIANAWNDISGVVKSGSETSFRLFHDTSKEYVVDDTIEMTDVLAIDLTAIFGIGKEPTKEAMDNLLDTIGGWFDSSVAIDQQQLSSWYLSLFKKTETALNVQNELKYALQMDLINGMSMVARDYGSSELLYMLEHRVDSTREGMPTTDELFAIAGGRYLYKTTDGVNFEVTHDFGEDSYIKRQLTTGDGKHIVFNTGTAESLSGTIEVYSSDYLTVLSTTPFDHTPYGIHGISQNPFTRTVCYAEYSTALPNQMSIWRASPPNYNFTKVLTIEAGASGKEIRHFHVCAAHPTISGKWYASSGDEPSQCSMWVSSDDGVTWTKVINGDSRVRATQYHFDGRYVYWVEDNSGGGFYRMNKDSFVIETLIPRNVLSGEGYSVTETPFGYVCIYDKITAPYTTGGEHLDPDNAYIYFIDFDFKHHLLLKTPYLMMSSKSRAASAMTGYMYTNIRPNRGSWANARIARLKLIVQETPYG